MPSNTPNLNLKTYNSTTDGSATFLAYRSDQAGISPTSNMNIIDSWAGNISASLVSLLETRLIHVSAMYISENYYEATTGQLNGYYSNAFISLTLNETNTGSVALNINALGSKYLKKYNLEGNLIDFENGELKKYKEYIFRYNGTYWVLISANIADQISINGNNSNLIMISPCGVLIDSGISASSIGLSHISASSITAYGTEGNLLMISGSGEYSTIADSGFSVYDIVSASSVAPSDADYLLISLDANLPNAKQIIAGTGINFENITSTSSLKINTNIIAGSGISLIKNTSASSITIKNNLFIDQSGSSVKTYGTISGSINGSNCDFIVSNQKFVSGTLLVYLNGQLQTQGSDDDWIETSASLGVFTFVRAPTVGDKIICQYLSKE